jgi:hypothetical protein
MCINDLPPRISTLSEPLIFGDETYVILHKNVDGFPSVLDIFLSDKNKWFTANKFKRLQVLPLPSEFFFLFNELQGKLPRKISKKFSCI